MTTYEISSLVVTGIYDILTFCLLLIVAYDAVFRRRQPDIALYVVERPSDTKLHSWEAALLDFVLDNRGPRLNNVRVMSTPDDIGWKALDAKTPGVPTSQYFSTVIGSLAQNERHQLLWCEASANNRMLTTPFTIVLEFDNPHRPWGRKRLKRSFAFDFSAWSGIYHGANVRYDVHNVARELARIREQTERLNHLIPETAKYLKPSNRDPWDF